jgi:hypothetical protein
MGVQDNTEYSCEDCKRKILGTCPSARKRDCICDLFEKPTPCKFCGDLDAKSETKMCDRCWEVDGRINGFLKKKKARDLVRSILAQYID